MEGVAVNVYRNLKGFCKTRGYKRLNAAGRRRRRIDTAELGGNADPSRRRRRRFWRIRISPKLRLISPKKFLIRLREAYINFMLRLASSSAIAGASGGYGAVDYGVAGFGLRPVVREYDEKAIIEIYKSMVMAQGKPVNSGPGNNNNNNNNNSNIICA